MSKPIEISVYCDGGCDNRHVQDHKAYGSFAIMMNGDKFAHKTFDFPHAQTNNEAEYGALLEAFKYIEQFELDTKMIPLWKIRTDSELMHRQLIGRYRVKAENLKPLYEKAMLFLRSHSNIKVEWVPREYVVRVLGH